MEMELAIFLNQAKQRNLENQKAFKILYDCGLYGVAIGLLRQELDTLIRLCYLFLSRDLDRLLEAKELIKQSINGEQWMIALGNSKKRRITDREMVDLAYHLGGWEQLVYKFGCKLIHLSDFHLYLEKDPFENIPHDEKMQIIEYMVIYHEYPYSEVTFETLIEYLPAIMEKISSNICGYIEDLPIIFED